MKKITTFIAAVVLLFGFESNAQSFDLGMLDNAMSMLNKGDQKAAAPALGGILSGLTSEIGSAKGDFAPKILGQVGKLSSFIPALKSGTANVGAIQKIISSIKMLMGAQRLKGLLGGSSLLGQSKAVNSNIGLITGGLSSLEGGSSVDKITKVLGKVTDKSAKLEKTGLFANIAQKAISKKLGSSLNLLGGLI